MTNKLVLLDGNSIAYRAFFALPLLSNDKGIHTNAVYGFTTMLLKILEDEQPSHLLVAFDAGKTTFRHKTYEEYKGGREKTPSELSEQFPVIRELLDHFGIRHYELPQYEADDIIGTLARQAEQEGFDVKVISGDRDLLQLVSERVSVAMTKKGITNIETYTPSFMEEKVGVRTDQFIDLKALMGDSSDNIPGVPGVGEKTAVKLLTQFGNLDSIYDNLDQVSGKKLKEKLETNKEEAYMSQQLVTIEVAAPIEVGLADVNYDGYDTTEVSRYFKELGFQSLMGRITGEEVEEATPEDLPELHFTILEEVKEEHLGQPAALVVEMLGENYHTAEVEGIGLVHEAGAYFIPTSVAMESELFKSWLEDSQQEKYVFDSKKTYVALKRFGIEANGLSFDLLIASYLINPSENHHDIPSISQRTLKTPISYDENVYGKGAKMKVPEQSVLAEHVVRKTDALFQMKSQVVEQLQENEQRELFNELEMPLSTILGNMEHTGVKLDLERLNAMGEELKERLGQIESDVYELAGETFNLNSPKQLGPILFEKLELPVIKKTKTGYSTSADILEQLRDKHEIIPKILIYRQLGKLQSTYIEGLLKLVTEDEHKIHTRFNQALTQTGRLSSTEPNLQNIPIRLEEGRKIRQAFIPSVSGWKIFAADYSQIELRVLAHIANDDKLIQAFNDSEDIHTKTAMDVFHVNKEDVTDQMRRQAKAVNFGIVYGISDFGLSQSLGISRKEAKTFIERYLESYPGVKDYMEEVVQNAKQTGYVTTLMNRRRYLPDLTSRNFNQKSAAERTAMNTPIQGTAADIIKKAMIDLHERLEEEQFEANLLLQVHDELILEAPEHELEKLKDVVVDVMEHTIELSVPLKVDYSYGPTWYDAK
ncbi:DNA polymerase I [Pontibacillus halophilus JSM 076056 = DSM 19796]|uniref:DNA polymerase I n=1 Tax=Pontibacillus halophilus JSM 076056 = DSM 19796 TaxID=1385510 RepID=A0A0A5GQE2_9BACI|nr:DNA polymerase I [Pontibacillus halophilus]KGX93390.1 DNA polymerase I [Pontibacillus halophilus JSM 076056 = DSM 19796]